MPVQTDPAGGQTAGAGENTLLNHPVQKMWQAAPECREKAELSREAAREHQQAAQAAAGRPQAVREHRRVQEEAAEQFPVEARSIARGRRQRSSSGRWPRSSRPIRGGGSMRTAGQGPGGFEKRDGHINPGQELIFAGSADLAGARRILEAKRKYFPGDLLPHF